MEEQKEHKRRVRYKGTHPRNYNEKYKELNPEKYQGTIEHVIQKGSTPAGMHIPILVDEILDFLKIEPGQNGLDACLLYTSIGYQLGRIQDWLSDDADNADGRLQQQNSITAIGSGKLTGKGLNNNKVSSANKGNFVSQNHNDFIFAVAGEELGFFGCCGIILLLFLILVECIRTSRKAKDLSGTLICCGMAGLIAFQSFLNISVATGILPNTGTPVSYTHLKSMT